MNVAQTKMQSERSGSFLQSLYYEGQRQSPNDTNVASLPLVKEGKTYITLVCVCV